jgi:hypothetical protein
VSTLECAFFGTLGKEAERRTSKNDIWQQQDGKQRAGLSCMSWHCRVSAIGRGKPKRNTRAASRGATSGDGFYSDEISL